MEERERKESVKKTNKEETERQVCFKMLTDSRKPGCGPSFTAQEKKCESTDVPKDSEGCLRTDNPHDSKRPIVIRSLSQNKGLFLGQVMLLFPNLTPAYSPKPCMGAGARC